MKNRVAFWLVIILLAATIVLVAPHITLFEDGSWILGSLNGCLPGGPCGR